MNRVIGTHRFEYLFHEAHQGKAQDKYDNYHGETVNIIRALTANYPPELAGEQDNCSHDPLFWVMTRDDVMLDAFRSELVKI